MLEERKIPAVQFAPEELFRQLVERAPAVFYLADPGPRGAWRYVSPQIEALLGFTAEEWTSDPDLWFNQIHPDDRARAVEEEERDYSNGDRGRYFVGEYRMLTRSGETRWIRDEGSVIRDLAGMPPLWGGVLLDISDRKELEEQLQYRALHDYLTGLPNRALFMDRLEHALQRALRTGQAVAVLFIDLDGFKDVNDCWGHAAGDRLLVQVGERLAECVRPSDTIARFGGDEFAVLLEDVPDEAIPLSVADRMMAALRRGFNLDAASVSVSASIGVAVGKPPEIDRDSLLLFADRSMYSAKRAGEGKVLLYGA